MHTDIHTCACTHTYTFTHTETYTYTQKHAHTYKQIKINQTTFQTTTTNKIRQLKVYCQLEFSLAVF